MIFSNTTPLFAFAALGRFDLLEKVHGRDPRPRRRAQGLTVGPWEE
jgi:predicted nucleic acid-binding protein